jgi:hypothetical protein
MIKIRVLNKDKKDVMVLVNPACIVTVEQAGEDHYKVYLSDGRILNMTEEMYEDHFEEYEEEQELSVSYGGTV